MWILPASVVDPGTLAAVRSLVLATATIALVVAGRSNLTRELTWLVYPLLAIGGAKLLLVDLQICRAVILFSFCGLRFGSHPGAQADPQEEP